MNKSTLVACSFALMALVLIVACNESKPKTQMEASEKSAAISVITREAGSGTRDAFTELVGTIVKENGKKKDITTKEALTIDGTQGVMSTVAGNEYAIGYISLGSWNNTIKALSVDGVEPSKENVKAAKYPISRSFNIATKGEVSKVTEDFINFIMSDDGQKVIEENGYISISEGTFESTMEKGKIVIAGSSSVTPVMEKLKEAYLKINTNAEIEIQESDSTTGMTAAMEGTCDIGMASRELKDSELDGGLTSTAIAMDGIAVIVNKNNDIEDITSEQVKNIFLGEVTDWSEL